MTQGNYPVIADPCTLAVGPTVTDAARHAKHSVAIFRNAAAPAQESGDATHALAVVCPVGVVGQLAIMLRVLLRDIAE